MIPDEKVLLDNLGKIAYTLDKAYIPKLTEDYSVWPFADKYNKDTIVCPENNIRILQVDRWVFDKKEKPGDCFKNMLSLFADGDHSLAVVILRRPVKTEMYFVIKNIGHGRNEDSKNNVELLNDSIKGNFPGTHTSILTSERVEKLLAFESCKSVAVLSNTPSAYSEDYISQGLDKLLNGIVPQREEDSYAVIFLADSLTTDGIRDIISGFEEIATAIYPFMGYQFQMSDSKTDTQGEMRSVASTESISNSVFRTHSINVGLSGGISGALGSIGASLGVHGGYGYNWGQSKTVANGTTDTSGTSSSISIGESESTSYSYKSFMVSDLLEKTESTIQRLSRSQSTGLWKFATYVLAGDTKTSKNVANYLKAVTQGKDSYIEPSVIQEWQKKEGHEPTDFSQIKDYVTHFTHPVFYTADANHKDEMMVTPTAYVATDEISNVIAFPRKSVSGLPVLECVQFGREPHALISTNSHLEIGHAYHMHEVFDGNSAPKQRISLSKEELTKHTFVTGSTGSGKSNTIYTLLRAAEVGFLVIEPAKGEYKHAFTDADLQVFGTNPNKADSTMLKLNPFSFPNSIHVLEHLDRLVEIFNVCWPMFAAMPAILKDSLERAYTNAGWSLHTSINRYDDKLFPTFSDVLDEIRNVLRESDYSDDNKGDYTGSLVTRIKSLTNGINGLIFTTDEISEQLLFDGKAIVDLSRVGSTETKSLIMGILVLKLQEHRMHQRDTGGIPNEKLRHVTVLEEAHNLLRRTSVEQTTDGANLLGKAVEMLSNAIAEMRSYGEGFIIADQSPGLLDMSVIRNTNTKIILRLPDYSDRELVGKSAGLNDDQIVELARLERGVASITQSDWLEPVLCKIDKYIQPKIYGKTTDRKLQCSEIDASDSLLECIMTKEIYRKGDRVDIEKIKDAVIKSRLETSIKIDLIDYLNAEKKNAVKSLRKLVYDFFHASRAVEGSKEFSTITNWANSVLEQLDPSPAAYSKRQIDLVLALIVFEQSRRDISYTNIYHAFTEKYRNTGGVV